MSSVGTPNAGNDDGKMSDGLTPSLPHANNASPLSSGQVVTPAVDCEKITGSQLKAFYKRIGMG